MTTKTTSFFDLFLTSPNLSWYLHYYCGSLRNNYQLLWGCESQVASHANPTSHVYLTSRMTCTWLCDLRLVFFLSQVVTWCDSKPYSFERVKGSILLEKSTNFKSLSISNAFIVFLNVSNIFGSVKRIDLANKLTKFVNVCLNAYFYTINTMTSNGDIYDISTGVLQDVALDTFLFSLTLQPALDYISSSDNFKFNLFIFSCVNSIYLFGKYDRLITCLSNLQTQITSP